MYRQDGVLTEASMIGEDAAIATALSPHLRGAFSVYSFSYRYICDPTKTAQLHNHVVRTEKVDTNTHFR